MPLGHFIFACDRDCNAAWSGFMSTCTIDGPIVNFVKQTIEELPMQKNFILPNADGFSPDRNYMCLVKDYEDLNWASKPDDIVGILCSRNFDDPRCVYLPLDDKTFDQGLIATMREHTEPIPWEEKIPIAFWRGHMSGGYFPDIRFKLVDRMMLSERVNAKLIVNRSYLWLARCETLGYGGLEDDDRYWSEFITLQDHLKYKYILIVDGNCIASSHQWVFASGCVPIMLSHPENKYWFKEYLEPMVNYVPVDYDLSNLEEMVQWLIDNDDEARKIAENAVKFAEKVFSPEFQQNYLRNRIQEVSQNSSV